ncbi:transcription factor MYB35-like [Pyrus communis]|uniref:transcription factor MYB35-like n=1 Tax=Pyrus communis TaxID=23211 RepID=UPI0035C2522B
MGGPPCCDKSNVKRGLWTAAEDAKILAYVSKHGVGNWTLVPKKTGSIFMMGIDPVTHKPYSQILSDCGNISGLPSTAVNHPFSSFFNQSKSAFAPELNSSCITGTAYTNVIMNPNINGQGSEYNSSASTLGFLAHRFQERMQIEQPHILNEVTSSCSSSSSPRATDHQLISQPTYTCRESHEAQITLSSSSFNRREYLLHDPFTSADHLKQEQDLHGVVMSSSENPTLGVQGSSDAIEGCDFVGQRSYGLPDHQTSSTSMCSFVETILDQDSEMQAAFPQLLDASFDY